MILISYFNELNGLTKKYFRKGTLTNNYILPEAYKKLILQSKLFFEAQSENLILYRLNENFYNGFYYLNDLEQNFSIKTDKPVVLEILFRGRNLLPENIYQYFEKIGFKRHLVRDNLFSTFEMLSFPDITDKNIEIKTGESDSEAGYVFNLFKESFDYYTGDFLTLKGLKLLIKDRNIYCAYYTNKLCGALHFENRNNNVWLDHIAIDPEFRGLGIASALVRHYIMENSSGKQTRYRLWVRQDNPSAVKLYEKYGFVYANKSSASMLKL